MPPIGRSSFCRSAVVIACVSLLSACANNYSYTQEDFSTKGPFDNHYSASRQVVFESLKRVMLRQGFALEKADKDALTLVVSKQYQHGDRNSLLTISGLVSGGDGWADSWVAAQEVTLKSDSATQTTSVGLGLGLSIPIPTGTVSTLAKAWGETLKDPALYAKIYAAVEQEIPEVTVELKQSSVEDDARMKAEIEQRIRIEAEVRAKMEKEAAEKNVQHTMIASAPAVQLPAPVLVPPAPTTTASVLPATK